MSDDATTRADLLSRFADNTTGNITASDSRALTRSALGCYGAIALLAPQPLTTIGTSWTKLVNFDTAGVAFDATPDIVAGEIEVGVAGLWVVQPTICVRLGGGVEYRFRVAVNGAGDALEVRSRGPGGAPIRTIAWTGLNTALLAGDKVSVEVQADAPGSAFRFLSGGITANRVQ